MIVTLVRGSVMLVAYPLYLRYLGAERYGLWLTLGALLSLAQLGNLGITTALTKLVSECRGRGDHEGVVSYIFTAATALMASGSAMILLLSSLRQPLLHVIGIYGDHARIVAWLFPIAGALTVYMFVIEALNASVAGVGRMDLSNYLDCGARFAGVVISATLLSRGWGIEALPMGTFCTYFIMNAVVIRILRTRLGGPVFRWRHWRLDRMRSLLRLGGGMLSASVLGMLIGPLNKAFISRYVGLGAVSTYELAYSAAMQFRAVGEAGIRALMPEVSRLGSQRDPGCRNAVRTLTRRALLLTVALGLPVFLTVFAGSGILLKVWLGSRATVALQHSFRILIAGTFLGLLGAPCYYTLVGLGNVRAVVQAYAAWAVTNLVTVGIGLTMWKMSVALAASGCALGMGVATVYVIWAAARITNQPDLQACGPGQQLFGAAETIQPKWSIISARGTRWPGYAAGHRLLGRVAGRTIEDL